MTEQRLNTVAAVAAAVVGGVMLVLLLIGGMFVDEAELRDALDATETELKTELKADLSAAEGRITTAINESNNRTDAQDGRVARLHHRPHGPGCCRRPVDLAAPDPASTVARRV